MCDIVARRHYIEVSFLLRNQATYKESIAVNPWNNSESSVASGLPDIILKYSFINIILHYICHINKYIPVIRRFKSESEVRIYYG